MGWGLNARAMNLSRPGVLAPLVISISALSLFRGRRSKLTNMIEPSTKVLVPSDNRRASFGALHGVLPSFCAMGSNLLYVVTYAQ